MTKNQFKQRGYLQLGVILMSIVLLILVSLATIAKRNGLSPLPNLLGNQPTSGELKLNPAPDINKNGSSPEAIKTVSVQKIESKKDLDSLSSDLDKTDLSILDNNLSGIDNLPSL